MKENYQKRSECYAGCFLNKMRNEEQLSLIEKYVNKSNFFFQKKILTLPFLRPNYSTEHNPACCSCLIEHSLSESVWQQEQALDGANARMRMHLSTELSGLQVSCVWHRRNRKTC